MLLIAARVMKIYFSVLNNRVVPIGHINSAIGAHRNIYRPESHMVGP